MSSEDLIRLKLNNEKLLKTNRKLNEMLKLMEKFRVLLISMVNNCKCNTESNIRISFNLLMEDYYDLNLNNTSFNCYQLSPKNNKFNDINDKSIIRHTEDNCNQIDVKSVVNNLLSDQTVVPTEDNLICVDNQLIDNQMMDNIDETEDQRRDEKEKLFESMTKSDDGKDLDLKERIARLRRYVSRPKIYSRINRPRIRSNQTYECSWPGCDSVFKAKVDMKTHLWRHTGEKIYACNWPGCDKRFPVKRNLQRHSETHEGVKQYACDWPGCEYKSWYPQGVRAHKKRHTDERPHKCTWPSCEWTFRQGHHLKAHMLKHTGEKPFSCNSCDQRFQSRQAMKFHFDRTHLKS